ncbi:MAG: hypothetical protein V3T05_01260 [Myxococcota bacterium]
MTMSLAALRQKVSDQLGDARRLIARLRSDLAESNAEKQELARDRDRLQRALVQIDVLRIERAEAESQVRTSRLEQKQTEELLCNAEEDNRHLTERCAGLERALARERADVDAARLETRCLEQQIDQMQSIVDMLSGESKIGQSP